MFARPVRLLLVTAALAVVGATACQPLPPPPGAPRPVLVYGDSLAQGSASWMTERYTTRAPSSTLELRVFGGTAPCDWRPKVPADLAAIRPRLVVFEFLGNSFTNCMKNSSGAFLDVGSSAYLSRYRADLRALFQAAKQAKVPAVFIAGPPTSIPQLNAATTAINNIAAQEAARVGNTRVDTRARRALSPDGAYHGRLSCLPDEGPAHGCAAGTIPVRSADGVHFCNPATAPLCSGYQSGARRFGEAIIDAAFATGA